MPIVLCLHLLGPACSAATIRVDAGSPADGPGTAWSNAFRGIQAAIVVAADDDTVLVMDGVYEPVPVPHQGDVTLNGIVIDRRISLVSVNGPASTVIAVHPSNAAMRVMLVATQAHVRGFTIEGGVATSGASPRDRAGGGVLCLDNRARFEDCIIRDCEAGDGGGLFGGQAINCTITNNDSRPIGGYSSDHYGGGAYGSLLIGCRIQNNSAYDWGSGGGTFRCTNSASTIESNDAQGSGGACYFSELQRCVVRDNYGAYTVLARCDVESTLVTRNRTRWDTVCHQSRLYHCTIVSNDSWLAYAGGLRECEVHNSIVRRSPGYSGSDYESSTFAYSLASPLPSGAGNRDEDPLFVDEIGGDYHLMAGSPAIDAGTHLDWMAASTDLDGHPRVYNGVADMGAYEACFDIADIRASGGGMTVDAAVVPGRGFRIAGIAGFDDAVWQAVTGDMTSATARAVMSFSSETARIIRIESAP